MRPFLLQLALFLGAFAIGASPSQAMTIHGPQELATQLATARGGEVFDLVASSDPYAIKLTKGFDPGSPVTIRSANPTAPAVFDHVWLRNAHGLTIEGVRFESGQSDRPDWQPDIFIEASSDITIANTVMRGTAKSFNDGTVPVGRDAVRIRDTEGFTFIDNDLARYNFGVQISGSTHLTLARNKVHYLQADGFQFAGVSDVTIAANRFENFLGSLFSINHNDMIQFMTATTTSATRNVVIRDNILDSGNGSWTQSIFFGNERVRDGAGMDMYYQDISIENNQIRNNNWHGITLYESLNVSILNNRISTNPDTPRTEFDNDGIYIIVADKSQNVALLDNVADKIVAPASARLVGNITHL